MAKSKVRTNKKHGGKEFRSYFHFVGQVSKHVKGYGDEAEEQPYFQQNTTRTNKERRSLQFTLETAKHNTLKIEQNGMPMPNAYAYSSTHKRTEKLDWEDRNDKSKLPDDTYHVMESDWDKTERLAGELEDGAWVEVKGQYEFDSFKDDDGKTHLMQKRMVNEINRIEDGAEIKQGKDTINYVTDFDSDDFVEVNYVSMQVGIKTTYQDENTNNTKVNGVFLDYGKERSTPKDVELMVYYKEAEEGKRSLADAFEKLEPLSFVEVIGQDNNRPEFGEVEEDVPEVDDDDLDPFADVDESEMVVRKGQAITGNRKGIEITGIVKGSFIKEFLTEEEIAKDELLSDDSPFDNIESDPFEDTDINEDDPFS